MILSVTASYLTGAGALYMVVMLLALVGVMPAVVGIMAGLGHVAVRRNLRIRYAVLIGAATGVSLGVFNYAALWMDWHPVPLVFPLTGYLMVTVVPATLVLCEAVSRYARVSRRKVDGDEV